MSVFLGRYEYQMDPKGRLSLPADFRRKVESGRFVLLQWESSHLTLFPDERWTGMQEEVLALRRDRRKLAPVLREVMSRATDLTPDRQGRILVPAWFKERAGLDGTVLVLGVGDRMELWDPARYEAQRPEPEDLRGAEVEEMHRILG